MIAMALPEKVDATLTVRTYNGGFKSTFPIKLGDDQNPRKRFTLTLGNGSAHIELESFGGTIALRRPGEPRPEVERERRHRDHAAAANDEMGAQIERAVDDAMRGMEPAIGAATASIGPAIDAAMHDIEPMLHVDPMPVPRVRMR
jgi:hypothetical protein